MLAPTARASLARKRSVNAGKRIAANATRRVDDVEGNPCLHRFGERTG